MTYVDWNGEPLPQEHQSPEKFEMDAEFYPKRVAELEQQLAESQAREMSLRDDMKLASVQYMGCGGNLSPQEVVDAMLRVLNRSLATPSNSTALDEALKQAKLEGGREALLEAADYLLKRGYQGNGFELSHDLRRMALEDHPMNQTP
jgi:hypothetical protein